MRRRQGVSEQPQPRPWIQPAMLKTPQVMEIRTTRTMMLTTTTTMIKSMPSTTLSVLRRSTCLCDCSWMRTWTASFPSASNPRRRSKQSSTRAHDSSQSSQRELARESVHTSRAAGGTRELVILMAGRRRQDPRRHTSPASRRSSSWPMPARTRPRTPRG